MADKRSKSSRRHKKESCAAAESSANKSAVDSKESTSARLTDDSAGGCAAVDPACANGSGSAEADVEAQPESAVTVEWTADNDLETQPESDPAGECTAEQTTEVCSVDEHTEECAAHESPSGRHLTQHHVSKILDAVLEEDVPEGDSADSQARFRCPVLVDGLLGAGLLIAVAGFTIGLFKMYVTHQAQQYILQQDYQRAIVLLHHNPLPPIFNVDGKEPDETLAQALWLDSLKKSESGDTNGALSELEQIRPGSKYFDEAQRTLADNFEPSGTVLQCSVSQDVETSSR